VHRARLAAAVLLLWAALVFLVGRPLIPRGLDRPVTLAAAHPVVVAALATLALLWLGAYSGQLIVGGRNPTQGLLVVALALGLWPIGGGTMDQWLLLAAPGGAVGPPQARPYAPLLAEYAFLAIAMTGAAIASGLATRPAEPGAPVSLAGRVRRSLGLPTTAAQRREGWLALLLVLALFSILMLALTGPAVGRTLRGQVYFAVAAAGVLAVFVTTRLLPARQPLWFWPVPLVAGLLGTLVALLRPGLFLPAAYNHLNMIPAWGLTRPLPLEMVGVGVAACLLTLSAAPSKSPTR
jgi:hypothetical protein